MKSFLPAHLIHNIQLLDRYLEFLKSKDPVKIKALPIVKEKITWLKQKFLELLHQEELTSPDLLKRNLKNFKTLLGELDVLQSFGIPIVTHYKDQFDGYLAGILAQLCKEVNCPVDPPHVCTLSIYHEYYFYRSDFDTIFIPSSEKFTSINFPDLLHELGHHILRTYKDILLYEITEWVSLCRFNTNQWKHMDKDKIASYNHQFPSHFSESWCHELICDLIAVYCIGEAYAWSHLKISQIYPLELSGFKYKINYGVYHYSDTHPSNAYRMDSILNMLLFLQLNNQTIQEVWSNYIKANEFKKPPYHDLHFPKTAIPKIVEHVYNVCKDMGLTPCTDNLLKQNSIIYNIDKEWKGFLTAGNRWSGNE